MEFATKNLINTTTMIAVNSNTLASENLFNRDPFYQYVSDNLADDSLTAQIIIDFGQTTPVSRIGILDTNAKEFKLFYDGVTASTFPIQNADTAASSWLNFSSENLFIRFATLSCRTITLDIKKTQVANQEKLVGLFYIGDLIFDMTRVPSSKGYKPVIVPMQVVHKMSDGGVRLHNVRKKHQDSISFDYLPADQTEQVKALYDYPTSFQFIPFGTATSWNGYMYEAIWDGNFGFYEFSGDAVASGHTGKITLKETTG